MKSFFENVKLNQLKLMLGILLSAKESSYQFIRERYRSHANNFEGTFKFLKDLHLLNISSDVAKLKEQYKESINVIYEDEKRLKHYMAELILRSSSKLSEEARSYLKLFKGSDSLYIYSPLMEVRSKESDIRNFFIELGLVQYNSKEDRYEIVDTFIPLFSESISRVNSKKLTPEDLIRQLEDKDKLGKAAECEIFEYERERLACCPHLLNNLEMTARLDVMAGYDIKSFEISDDKINLAPRYIEVKAVSGINYQFKWTRNEIDVAKLSKKKYYLYLLPVLEGSKKYTFDIENLKIIQDPFEKIFEGKNNNSWEKQEELYTIWSQDKKIT